VDTVITTGADYVDLGFFSHPEEASSYYFMLVNRDGIADMDTATIAVRLYFDNMQKVELMDMADSTDTILACDPVGYFTFVDTFAPGQESCIR